MLGSMYSGVSGMKVHQSKLNVIGNNIANVNTYGFKSSRATFRDVYYQTVKGGSAGSSSAGGSNASQVGYGAQLGSIDLMMNRTSFQMTDRAMDLAVDGEGFFQVQDAAGNKFYTRAGQLQFDSAGNLTDAQGNFVLGVSGNPLGKKPGSGLIQLQIPPVPPSASAGTDSINDVKFNITSSNNTKDGNVSFQFIPGSDMADEELVKANVGTSGIVISVNPSAEFTNMADFSNQVNQAITDYCMANNGAPHPAGDFTISCEPAAAFAGKLTGKQICSDDFGMQYGKLSGWPGSIFSGITPSGISGSAFGKLFTGTPPKMAGDPTMTYRAAVAGGDPACWEMSMVIDGVTYTGKVEDNEAGKSTGKFYLRNAAAGADANDYIEMKRPAFASMVSQWKSENPADPQPEPGPGAIMKLPTGFAGRFAAEVTGSKTVESSNLGLSSKKFLLRGGTVGGPQGIENLSGIVISSDGVITAQHAVLGDITIGRIDLVTFANPEGLLAMGGTYFSSGPNSGNTSFAQPGQDGAGPLVSGSLEMSNVDLSREFSDMITTQRGFQANTRIITVSDEILNELVNLKR